VEDFMSNTSLKIGSRELQVADPVEYSSILGCDAALLVNFLLHHSAFIFSIK
jgi:hypothetical protein